MKRGGVAAAVAVTLFFAHAARAGAAPADSVDPVAAGLDVGTTASSAFVGAAAASFSLDLPLGHSVSLQLQPSAYYASGTSVTIFQLTVITSLRFYVVSLFVTDPRRQAQWGPFVSGGAAVAWARMLNGSTIDAVSFGPDLAAGYRLVFGNHGIFIEPSVGWMALYGATFNSSKISSAVNTGVVLGMILGWRF
ncbi:MAG TPA: hypothetical protein VMU36_00455 [Spirochaetia bacterium]|nr:hypothetical protein [Spirochaetia bacterium]